MDVHAQDGVVTVHRCENNNRKKREREDSVYTQLYLTKTGVESFSAIAMLCAGVKCREVDVSTSGTKDKMAVTCQQVRIHGDYRHKLLTWQGDPDGRIRVSNITYQDKPLELGKTSGNRFRIVIRNVTGGPPRVASWVSSGFINYFGTQRFGTEATWYPVAVDFIKGDYRAAYERLAHTESMRRVVRRLGDPTTSAHFERLIHAIPFGERTMFFHAFQSLGWNSIVSSLAKEREGGSSMPPAMPLPGPVPHATHQHLYDAFLAKYGLTNLSLQGEFAGGVRIKSVMRDTVQFVKNAECVVGGEGVGEGKTTTLTVSFDLPPSTYATVALRQLMRS